MISHGEGPFLECSSQGDKRFSAYYARLQGEQRTIEEIYQAAKVFENGHTGLSIRKAKGRKPVNALEVRRLYSRLWDLYINENEDLLDVLISYKGLTDIYGQPGHACQATELWRIREAYELRLSFMIWGRDVYE